MELKKISALYCDIMIICQKQKAAFPISTQNTKKAWTQRLIFNKSITFTVLSGTLLNTTGCALPVHRVIKQHTDLVTQSLCWFSLKCKHVWSQMLLHPWYKCHYFETKTRILWYYTSKYFKEIFEFHIAWLVVLLHLKTHIFLHNSFASI